VEICLSDLTDAISLSDSVILSFIQVKQNKISWDKFLQIPAIKFEIINQQILDWNIPRITPNTHERTTTAKNMRILKYHLPSLIVISYESCCPLACLDGLLKPNLYLTRPPIRVLSVSIIIETSAVWPWCRRSFQDICRRLDNYSWAFLWLISHDLSHGVCPSWIPILKMFSWGVTPPSRSPPRQLRSCLMTFLPILCNFSKVCSAT
jgi:hypothetical protein